MRNLSQDQFQYPTSEDDPDVLPHHRGQFERVHRAYGSNDPETVIKGDVAPTPWPRVPRSKKGPSYDRDLVRQELEREPQLEGVDPRYLHSTQPNITRQALSHYTESREYEEKGTTFADQGNRGNRYPVVYSDARGYNQILSGHHRASAALLRGEALQARRIRER